jgi:hypothetical protein
MKYLVHVFQDGNDECNRYDIEALTPIGACVKAFLRDGGGMVPDARGLVALALTWTRCWSIP